MEKYRYSAVDDTGQKVTGTETAASPGAVHLALLDRGYGADDIRKILGGNLLRVFREVERVSREMQAATPE